MASPKSAPRGTQGSASFKGINLPWAKPRAPWQTTYHLLSSARLPHRKAQNENCRVGSYLRLRTWLRGSLCLMTTWTILSATQSCRWSTQGEPISSMGANSLWLLIRSIELEWSHRQHRTEGAPITIETSSYPHCCLIVKKHLKDAIPSTKSWSPVSP